MSSISRSSSQSSMTESSEHPTERDGESSDAASPRCNGDSEKTPMSTSYHANLHTSRRQAPCASPASSTSPTRDIPITISAPRDSFSPKAPCPPSQQASLEDEEIIYVFVYGTLKQGFRNAKHMAKKGIQFFANGETLEPLALYTDPENRNRPCLARVGETGYQVRGELYGVKASLLPGLDKFERVPTHYVRENVRVKLDDDTPEDRRIALVDNGVVDAWVYLNVTDSKRAHAINSGKYNLLEDYTLVEHMTYTPRIIIPSPAGRSSTSSSLLHMSSTSPSHKTQQLSSTSPSQKARWRTSSEIPRSLTPSRADDERIPQVLSSPPAPLQHQSTKTRERIRSSASEVTIRV